MSENGSGSESRLYRYEDILRAVGRYIDENEMQDVLVLQADDEMRIHGYANIARGAGVKPTLIEHTFTAEEIQWIDEEARKRRGRGWKLFG